MIAATHQPNYLPYLGFFDKMSKSDIFFIMDDVQFVIQDFHHRNRIKTKDGPKWLTIPVVQERIPIKDIKIKNDVELSGMPWNQYHSTLIRQNYARARFFKDYFPTLEEIYKEAGKDERNLAENNMMFIDFLCDAFGIKVPKVLTSTLGINTTRSQRVVDICKALNADTYLSGDGGREYIDEKVFEDNGIKLVYQNYKQPQYQQVNGEFVPFMSAIDYLLNCGKCLPGEGFR
jgi:hypothetical protein